MASGGQEEDFSRLEQKFWKSLLSFIIKSLLHHDFTVALVEAIDLSASPLDHFVLVPIDP